MLEPKQQMKFALAVFITVVCVLVLFIVASRVGPCERKARANELQKDVTIARAVPPVTKAEPTRPVEPEVKVKDLMTRGVMIEENVMLWDMFFDDDGAKATDVRRGRFREYAEYVADAVLMYQGDTDIKGKIPKHRNVHLLVGTMMTIESSVTFDVVGPAPRFEVGMLQLHGRALAGFKRDKVKKNPQLGVLLGVRWLAAQIPVCYPDGTDQETWTDESWLGPLSVYQAGEKVAVAKNGKCHRLSVAKKRVRLTKMYRARIDHETKLRAGEI